MKTIRMLLITLAVAGLAANAEDKVVKTPEDGTKPVLKKPAPAGAKPVLKKPAPDGAKPALKKPAPAGSKPVLNKPAPAVSKPVLKKPAPAVSKPGIKKPGDHSGKTEFNSILKNCDDDKNGSVTLEEFRQHQPAGKDPGSVDQWFNAHDKDKDGVLTAADFAPPPPKK